MRRGVREGDTEMLKLVEDGFGRISQKELDSIDLKWYGIHQAGPYIPHNLKIILIVIGAAVLLLLVWIYSLRRAVSIKTNILSDTLEKYINSEREVYNLSIRDSLTGLYNRNYFENVLNNCMNEDKICYGIVVCDIDGLKLINDALGHSSGDDYLRETAVVLTGAFDNEDTIARIGGDEFAILVRDASHELLSARKKRILELLEQSNKKDWIIPISMSIGFQTGIPFKDNIREILKAADNFMYREKLHHMQSEKNNNIRMLSKLLEARDYITEGHGDRMQELSVKLAKAAGISETGIEDMRLFAQFHDIGKIGIPDSILFKPGKLTDEEMAEMKRHTEIGYRIAKASSDIELISDWILKHHEWWDGHGYPFNLKGGEIPLQCRILSIVDAYDSMTSNRPYRSAMSKEAAIEEITRFRGRQFDPQLVDLFVEQV
ncbi:MAG: diguanylate cyclase [Clostridiales bacterium]|nr:diguanylate cyclase [Clostridiales bacterium]